MLLRKKIIFVGFITLSIQSFGQRSEKQIGFGSGLSYYAVKNNSISSFTHTGRSLPIILFFRLNSEKNRHHAQFFYTAPNLEPASKLVSTQMQTGYFQYAYHRRFAHAKEKIRFFAGAVVNYSGVHRVTSWNNGFSDVTGEVFRSISPSILAEISLKESNISIQAWSSLLAYTATNGYTKWDNETNWLSLADFSSVDMRVTYIRNLSKKLGVRFDYKFEYYHLQKYQPVVLLSHQTLFSIFYKIH